MEGEGLSRMAMSAGVLREFLVKKLFCMFEPLIIYRILVRKLPYAMLIL